MFRSGSQEYSCLLLLIRSTLKSRCGESDRSMDETASPERSPETSARQDLNLRNDHRVNTPTTSNQLQPKKSSTVSHHHKELQPPSLHNAALLRPFSQP